MVEKRNPHASTAIIDFGKVIKNSVLIVANYKSKLFHAKRVFDRR